MKDQKPFRHRYKLVDKVPIACEDLEDFLHFWERQDRRVALDEVGEVTVSTVFLGIDYAFGRGQPVLFETMVFGGPLHLEQVHYCTWKEAESGHQAMMAKVHAALAELPAE